MNVFKKLLISVSCALCGLGILSFSSKAFEFNNSGNMFSTENRFYLEDFKAFQFSSSGISEFDDYTISNNVITFGASAKSKIIYGGIRLSDLYAYSDFKVNTKLALSFSSRISTGALNVSSNYFIAPISSGSLSKPYQTCSNLTGIYDDINYPNSTIKMCFFILNSDTISNIDYAMIYFPLLNNYTGSLALDFGKFMVSTSSSFYEPNPSKGTNGSNWYNSDNVDSQINNAITNIGFNSGWWNYIDHINFNVSDTSTNNGYGGSLSSDISSMVSNAYVNGSFRIRNMLLYLYNEFSDIPVNNSGGYMRDFDFAKLYWSFKIYFSNSLKTQVFSLSSVELSSSDPNYSKNVSIQDGNGNQYLGIVSADTQYQFIDSSSIYSQVNNFGSRVYSLAFINFGSTQSFNFGLLSSSNGFSDGYNSGYNDGVNDTNSKGGYDSGYNDGYNTANRENSDTIFILNNTINDLNNKIKSLNETILTLTNNEYSFESLFFSIGSIPFSVLKNIMNVELLGVNLFGIFSGIFTALILIWLIRKLLR